MSFTIKTTHELSQTDIESASEITALGFGRENDKENYDDTYSHLAGSETLQLAHDDERLVAFACYRRHLWRTSS